MEAVAEDVDDAVDEADFVLPEVALSTAVVVEPVSL
jgi:hypothetical protein